jgi:hypothetical protein
MASTFFVPLSAKSDIDLLAAMRMAFINRSAAWQAAVDPQYLQLKLTSV